MTSVSDPADLREGFSERYLQGIEYVNNSGTYVFSGWEEGHRPTQTFEAEDYIGCLHGVMFGLLFLSEPVYSHRAIEDDGMLHEIVHIMAHEKDGLKRSTYFNDRVTNQLKELEKRTLDKYNQLVQEQITAGRRVVHDFRPKPAYVPKERDFYSHEAQVQQEEVWDGPEGNLAEGNGIRPSVPVRV